MDEIILKLSKYSKNANISANYDVVEYNNKFYCGINLYKNFLNYLAESNNYIVEVYYDTNIAYKQFINKIF